MCCAEELVDPLEERIGSERLRQEGRTPADAGPVNGFRVAEARDEQHRHLWPPAKERPRQLRARHPGHHDVADQEVDRSGVTAREEQRGCTVRGGQHMVTAAGEDRLE